MCLILVQDCWLIQNTHRYLGPQTEYNDNLPPAAFPTLDNFGFLEARKRHSAPSRASRLSARSVNDANLQHTFSTSEQSSTESVDTSQAAHDKEPVHVTRTGMPTVQVNKSLLLSSAKGGADIESLEAIDIWEELSIYYRLEVLDSLVAACDPVPSEFRALHQLPLTDTQIEAMGKVLRDRQDRNETETRAQIRLNRGTTTFLMSSNVSVSEDRFRAALDRTIYKTIERDDHLVTNTGDLQNARLFLAKAGFNPELLDNVVPQMQNATTVQTATSVTVPAHGSPPHARARTWETNVPPPLLNPSRLAAPVPFKRRNVGDVSPSLNEQIQHNDRAVTAAVESDPRLQGGTSLTAGGGTRGLVLSDVHMKGRPVGDLAFEDWAHTMDHDYESGGKLLDRKSIQDKMEDHDILGEYDFDGCYQTQKDNVGGLSTGVEIPYVREEQIDD